MVMSADLLEIALRAIDDESATQVLADKILEDGWTDARAWALIERQRPDAFDPRYEGRHMRRWRLRALGGTKSRPGAHRKLARAVVAVLMLDGWPRHWVLADKNRRELQERTDRWWRDNPPWGSGSWEFRMTSEIGSEVEK